LECCACAYEKEKERAEEYSDYQLVYQQKVRECKEKFQQLELLRNYKGCKECGSLAVDAYSLYGNSRLVCQPCLVKNEGGSSSPISFLGQQK
jgi:formylmethanofuran dehydrogenase subunit E